MEIGKGGEMEIVIEGVAIRMKDSKTWWYLDITYEERYILL
jgi:hypothetical protein